LTPIVSTILLSWYNTYMAKTPVSNRLSKLNPTAVVVISVLIILIFGWIWWAKVYNSPRNVFNAMLENSLSTAGVTRHLSQSDGASKQDEYTQLNFGADKYVRIVSITNQQDQTGQPSHVETESLGTPDADYARYTKIQTGTTAAGKTPDYSKTLGIWGKSAHTDQSSQSGYFNQSILGLVPMGNLGWRQREDVLNQMFKSGVYTPDYKKVTSKKLNGRSVYVYEVNIKPQAYVQMLQSYVKAMGLTKIEGLDPSAYNNEQPITLQFAVDKTSRQLSQISFSNASQQGQRNENYSGYGIDKPLNEPKQTISFSELQSRIQAAAQ
jgi:hypothetical protein